MYLQNLIKTFQLYPFPQQVKLAKFYIQRKIKGKNLVSPSFFNDFIRLNSYLQSGVSISNIDEGRFRFKYSINGKETVSYLRKDNSDLDVFTGVVLWHEYKALHEHFLPQHEPIKYIVDAGGNVGLSALYLKRYFTNAKIAVVEPDKETFDILVINTQANDEKDIEAFHNALWTHNGEVSLATDYADGRSWSNSIKEQTITSSSTLKGITLDSLIQAASFPYIDIFKIDVEGAEFTLFNDQGFLNIINSKVRSMIIEIHDNGKLKDGIHTKMMDMGFAYKDCSSVAFYYKTAFAK